MANEVKNYDEVMESIDNAVETAEVAVMPEEKKSLWQATKDAAAAAWERVKHPKTKVGKVARGVAIGAGVVGGYVLFDKIKSGRKTANEVAEDCNDDYVEYDDVTDDYDYVDETSDVEEVETTEE